MSSELNTPAQYEQPALPPARRRRRSAARWLRARYAATRAYEGELWRYGSGGTAVIGLAAVWVAGAGMPTGFGAGWDALLFGTANMAGMFIGARLIAMLLALLYIPVPRMFAGYALYAGAELCLILYYGSVGLLPSVVMAAVLVAAGALCGIVVGLARRAVHSSSGLPAVLAAAGIALVAASIWAAPVGPEPAFQADGSAEDVAATAPGDPSLQGDYGYKTFTYGSGSDRHRAEFGKDADILSAPADASAYISKWPWLRTLFWGFDRKELPLNGRVWMPEGDGPYPLVLIVHGNHLMEDFSDDGYGYLGELLASRGYIAVSVDENFLNYSVWSGIPDNDMKARAWVLLKHLEQIKAFSGQTDNPFAGRVDFGSVALIGHSRGGQAVAMAGDADKWFAADPVSDSLSSVTIRSVVAIAPTDKKVDGKSAELTDVSYLTLQGARDADVNDFFGDRQYMRTGFDRMADGFKASLYMTNANHSQFNTSWGTIDEKLPGGLLLNLRGLMDGDDQRQAAKVYVSAFLEATIRQKAAYKPLFEDYRNGKDWLPVTTEYVSQYERAGFVPIADYEEDGSTTTIAGGGQAEGLRFDEWKESEALDRDRNAKGTKGVALAWSSEASYTLTPGSRTGLAAEEGANETGYLTFAIANLERDLSGEAGDPARIPLPAIHVRIETARGGELVYPLSSVTELHDPVYVTYIRLPWLERSFSKGKYKESNEPVFQTVRLPLGDAKPGDIERIAFEFGNGPGKVMLDNIGFTP